MFEKKLKRLYSGIYNLLFPSEIVVRGDKSKLKLGKNITFNGRVIFDLRKGGEIHIDDNCSLSEGVIFNPFGGKIELGKQCSVNPYSVLYGHGGLKIGNFVRIATHTIIIPANHIFDSIEEPICFQGLKALGITIEDDVWIGAGVKVLDGVTIKKGSILAAGSVINTDVSEYLIYGGIPGKKIGSRK